MWFFCVSEVIRSEGLGPAASHGSKLPSTYRLTCSRTSTRRAIRSPPVVEGQGSHIRRPVPKATASIAVNRGVCTVAFPPFPRFTPLSPLFASVEFVTVGFPPKGDTAVQLQFVTVTKSRVGEPAGTSNPFVYEYLTVTWLKVGDDPVGRDRPVERRGSAVQDGRIGYPARARIGARSKVDSRPGSGRWSRGRRRKKYWIRRGTDCHQRTDGDVKPTPGTPKLTVVPGSIVKTD